MAIPKECVVRLGEGTIRSNSLQFMLLELYSLHNSKLMPGEGTIRPNSMLSLQLGLYSLHNLKMILGEGSKPPSVSKRHST